MIDRLARQLPSAVLPRRLYPLVSVLIGAATLALSLTSWTTEPPLRLALFYLSVAVTYALMPMTRRGDVPLVAAWVILLSELSPCALGRMLSPANVLIDTLGVAMAVAPIYIARLRQVRQGDLGATQRRAMKRRAADMSSEPDPGLADLVSS